MGLLTKVISQIWRGHPQQSAPVLAHVDLSAQTRMVKQRIKAVTTPTEALECLRSDVRPLLEEVSQAGRMDLAAEIEALSYVYIVNATEQPEHCQACYDLLDTPLRELASRTEGGTYPTEHLPEDWRPKRWVFFVQNLTSHLAHSALLCDLIASYLEAHPAQATHIRVTGFLHGPVAQCFRTLQRAHAVQITPLPGHHGKYPTLQKLARQITSQGDERCIVVGPPFGVSFLSGILHAERLAWLSMKFELASFESLSHRFSFTSARRVYKGVERTHWRSAPPLLISEPTINQTASLPHAEHISTFATVFYTINREQKIRHPEFLDAVSRILLAIPDACFVWTGNKKLPEIGARFEEQGVGNRCFFVGWIEPDALLSHGHIFLDTPSLSGTVAAKAVACGRPVMTFQGAHWWVNFFSATLENDMPNEGAEHSLAAVRELLDSGLKLECATPDAYVQQSIALAKDSALRRIYAEGLRAFGQHYFLRNREYACMHFENFSSTLDDASDEAVR